MDNEGAEEITLARASFEELRYIFSWTFANESYRHGDVILIGGWAVHSFNPWKYSIDIDVIATGRFKESLKKHLYQHRNYRKERDSAGNMLYFKNFGSGNIYLDFLPKKDQFHGTSTLLNLMEIEYETIPRNISYSFDPGFRVIVPEVSMLLLLKLKAAWDRHYDLSLENTPNKDYLSEKFSKDCGDIIALLQSDAFQYARFDWLSSIISRFDFLRDFLESGIVEDNSTFDRISNREGKALIKKLLSLI